MTPHYYSIAKAAQLKGVSTQAMHSWVLRHKKLCIPLDSGKMRISAYLIPAELLDNYHPSPHHKKAGYIRAYGIEEGEKRAKGKKSPARKHNA